MIGRLFFWVLVRLMVYGVCYGWRIWAVTWWVGGGVEEGWEACTYVWCLKCIASTRLRGRSEVVDGGWLAAVRGCACCVDMTRRRWCPVERPVLSSMGSLPGGWLLFGRCACGGVCGGVCGVCGRDRRDVRDRLLRVGEGATEGETEMYGVEGIRASCFELRASYPVGWVRISRYSGVGGVDWDRERAEQGRARGVVGSSLLGMGRGSEVAQEALRGSEVAQSEERWGSDGGGVDGFY